MNKKKIFTLTGVIAAVLAIGGTSVACYSFEKSNSQQKNTENTEIQGYRSLKKYGIPPKRDIIEKYAIPSELLEPPVAKYAMPPELMIEHPMPSENAPVLKYATPPIYFDDSKVEDQDLEEGKVMRTMYGLPKPTESESKTNNDNQSQEQNPWK